MQGIDLEAVAAVAILAAATAAFAGSAKPFELAARRELLVDDRLIEKLEGQAGLQLHSPVPAAVALVHDKPWEGNTSAYVTVFRDGRKYRMYYRGWNHAGGAGDKATHPPVACYAESEDGVSWVRPALGLFEFEGARDNNIVWTGRGCHNFAPFLDANPDARPQEKYKALGGVHEEGGIRLFGSADGTRWKALSDKPVITSKAFAFDSHNLAFWDTARSEYRVYFRTWPGGRRGISTATSKDMVHWSEPAALEYPGAPAEHLYTAQILPYHRAPHLLLGFPARFIEPRGALVEGLFMTSRDGRTFRRWPEAYLRPGPSGDRWGNRSGYIWYGLVETESALPGAGKELSLYANEAYYQGGGARTRRYTCRLDGFVSLHAPMAGGAMQTRPLTFSGSNLLLNVSTSAAGGVRVEVQDADGKPLEGLAAADCTEIYGDSTDRLVRWGARDDLTALRGQPVRLRFVLKDADLYAFQFAPAAPPAQAPARR
ncbi:MAG TPA: hypothetical protein VM389_12530 [Phycisphaerae bacterium]|nr:hypothetical protein [Phycisphaerae bacterium]